LAFVLGTEENLLLPNELSFQGSVTTLGLRTHALSRLSLSPLVLGTILLFQCSNSLPEGWDKKDGGSGGSLAGTSGEGGEAQGGTSTGGSAGTDAGTGGTGEPYMLGADISSVQEEIDKGTLYADTDGTTQGIVDILKNHGFNYVRLRTFVSPMAQFGYAMGTGGACMKGEAYCDRDHTLEFGQQIKAAGMGFLLDFHYSDTWADPGKQIIPEPWRNAASIDELAALLKAYTQDVVSTLVEGGARPDMVQIGNEITPGMLIHVPSGSTDCWGNNSVQNGITGSTARWDDLATLLNAGIEGVKAVDEDIKIVLHIENTESKSGVINWVNNAQSRGVEFDVLALSCYPEWQGTSATWRDTFQTLATTFPELSFAIAEYNPERREANQIMRDLPDGRGLGTFIWEPTQSGVWGPSLFTFVNGAYHANSADFAEFDAMKVDFGL